MKKAIIAVILALFVSSFSYASNFSPTLLKISAEPVIQYDFDGSKLDIPFVVSGSPAGVMLLVFTKDKAQNMPNIVNGNMGWHEVNKIDTCLYFSVMKNYGIGANTISWDGRDQDGGVVAAGNYTYYLWAFDETGAKLLVSKSVDSRICHDYRNEIQEKDVHGLPLANPIIYGGSPTYGWPGPPFRWVIGNDPLDASLLQTARIPLAEGWQLAGDEALDPTDFSKFYVHVRNFTTKNAGIQKFKWVPSGDCELQTDFGNGGWSDLFSHRGGGDQGPGVTSDDTYLFACDEAHYATSEPVSALYIYDMDGLLVKDINLTHWWSNPNNFEAGGQMNGGPLNFAERNGKLLLNAHASCMNTMINPAAYLESEDMSDFCMWANGNGDYTLDHNFEETASLKWVCNDYNTGPYKTSVAVDANLFSVINAYDIGAVSFGMYAPDGTGLGYYVFAGDTAGLKGGTMIIDSDTPFDGIYTDNQQTGGTRFDRDETKAEQGIYFIGQDSITGTITNSVAVKEQTPEAFTVEQNTPNPFNPTTTITFNLVKAGTVSVEIFNVAGQKVATVANTHMNAGSHSVVWDASGFSAGMYFYTVKTGSLSKTMKMSLVK